MFTDHGIIGKWTAARYEAAGLWRGEGYQSGKVRYLGPSSMAAWQFSKALYITKEHGWQRFVAMQNHYNHNLINREEEREMIPLCVDRGVGLIPWSPLARRFFEGDQTIDLMWNQISGTIGVNHPRDLRGIKNPATSTTLTRGAISMGEIPDKLPTERFSHDSRNIRDDKISRD